ncbi:MAG: hypothetical protein K6F49_04730 [Saccharofermentans sp.]|nr:hypothetical protein [Saccharofermentans sp.]
MSEDNKIFDIPSDAENKAEETAIAVEEKVETAVETAVSEEPVAAVAETKEEVKSFFDHVEDKASEAEAKVEDKIEHAPLIAPVPEPAAPVAPATAAPVDPKAAKKAEKDAAAAAKKAEKDAAAAAKKAEKDAAAVAKKAEKEEAKKAKNQEKAAEEQAKIDACPKEYRPVSTSKYFWYVFISFIPVVGFIFTVIMSLIPKNKNIKNFMRAILVYFIIGIILSLVGLIVMVFVNGSSLDGIIDAFGYFIEELASA